MTRRSTQMRSPSPAPSLSQSLSIQYKPRIYRSTSSSQIPKYLSPLPTYRSNRISAISSRSVSTTTSFEIRQETMEKFPLPPSRLPVRASGYQSLGKSRKVFLHPPVLAPERMFGVISPGSTNDYSPSFGSENHHSPDNLSRVISPATSSSYRIRREAAQTGANRAISESRSRLSQVDSGLASITRPMKLMPRASNASLPHGGNATQRIKRTVSSKELTPTPVPAMDRPRAMTMSTTSSIASSSRSSPERKLKKKSSPHLANSAIKISGVEYAKKRSEVPDLIADDPFRRQTIVGPPPRSTLNLIGGVTEVEFRPDLYLPPSPPPPRTWTDIPGPPFLPPIIVSDSHESRVPLKGYATDTENSLALRKSAVKQERNKLHKPQKTSVKSLPHSRSETCLVPPPPSTEIVQNPRIFRMNFLFRLRRAF
ncbi:hypothetical protein SISNIDRAFT_496685 [Sistotremastrum niveocremeum HHB9708]|uniref:Uncharacterized protein n=2 Tax=Sistotremastraceae TaxID=3402574 RepID=A0A164RYM4_9AGAM|nr:hypothetical protein SISNIDRAFT_496685 [Sistotremastrum niveocremeum HHB9708]KZT33006.1 hypothetical protein SISSUDRAFT_1123101 [Sistotremastrum suecicum HHB10207 ss-3]